MSAQVHAIDEAGTAGQALTPRQVGHRLLVLAAALGAALALAAGVLAAGPPATPSLAGDEDGPYMQHQDPYLACTGHCAYPGP